MDLLPTSEQDEIVESVRSVLADRHTIGEPVSDALWNTAVEQGWFALSANEADGGVGYSIVEEALLFAEIGAACAPGPFLATALAANIAPALVIGDGRRVALAEPEGDGVRLFDAPGADAALLLDGAKGSIYDLDAFGELTEQRSLDELVPLSVGARPIAAPLATGDVASRARVLIASSLAGIARATTEQSVSYGKDREQFGQPIGGFQAVKHRCADMSVRADAALNQSRFAALAVRDGRSDAAFHAGAAHLVAINAALANTHWNIQNHGGIGFTWEHTAHRFLTRARVWSQLAGGLRGAEAATLEATAPE